mmetsp:Transcript_40228/g.69999  ORF Transcript_40228/g.69999 Transcript_40228/m.69999 type:complete len:108 (+) Transcript_40228:3-326(+)
MKSKSKRFKGMEYKKRGVSVAFRPTLRPLVRSATEANLQIENRPRWDDAVDMTWRKNLEHQAHNRHYFSDLHSKPVRAEILKKLEGKVSEMEEIKKRVREQRAFERS